MLVIEASDSSEQFRYQLLAQDFFLGNGACLLVIRDHENGDVKHFPVESLFNNNAFLSDMSPKDIKTIGYIQACEVNARLSSSEKNPSNWS